MVLSVSLCFWPPQTCADVRKVNGAGLAMNSNDAIADLGGMCANFLDTGGKATSETVKTSFNIILKDPRVKVVFVNIFGGLTLCDMIAEGIMLAYKELGISVPVVVRLRGTNEEMGQKMVSKEPFARVHLHEAKEVMTKPPFRSQSLVFRQWHIVEQQSFPLLP